MNNREKNNRKKEIVKLMENIRKDPCDAYSRARLARWDEIDHHADNAEWCRKGIEDSRKWYPENMDGLHGINDFQNLRSLFGELHGI